MKIRSVYYLHDAVTSSENTGIPRGRGRFHAGSDQRRQQIHCGKENTPARGESEGVSC